MKTKFCVLPGQEPVRIAKLDGRIILITEELREIDDDLHREAMALGAVTEEQLEAMKARFAAAPATPSLTPTSAAPLYPDAPAGNDAAAARAAKLKEVVAAVVNGGEPEKCTGAGIPKVAVVEDLCGFDVTASEIKAVFDELSEVK